MKRLGRNPRLLQSDHSREMLSMARKNNARSLHFFALLVFCISVQHFSTVGALLRGRTLLAVDDPPEVQKEIEKLTKAQQKANDAIEKQTAIYEKSKEHVSELKNILRKALLDAKKQKQWISKTKNMVEKLEKQKKSVRLNYDLQRIKPILKAAKAHQEQLLKEQKKWKSSSSEVSDRVRQIELELAKLKKNEDGMKDSTKTRKQNPSGDKTKDKNTKKEAKNIDNLLNELEGIEASIKDAER